MQLYNLKDVLGCIQNTGSTKQLSSVEFYLQYSLVVPRFGMFALRSNSLQFLLTQNSHFYYFSFQTSVASLTSDDHYHYGGKSHQSAPAQVQLVRGIN